MATKKTVSKKTAAKKAPAKKAPVKKVAARKVPAKKAAPVKKAPAKKKAPATKVSKKTAKSLSGEQLYLYAQEAAYYLAEKDGFAGDPMYYWLEAQKQLGMS